MKIKISKSQWQEMGRKAGWSAMSTYRLPLYVSKEDDGEGNIETSYGGEPLPNYNEIYVDVTADYDRGTRGGIYEEPVPAHWEIDRVINVENGEDLTSSINEDIIVELLEELRREARY